MKFIVLLILLPLCHGSLCPKGEYRSTFARLCLKCTECKPHEIVLRTCQSHKNTLCSTSYNHNTLLNENQKKSHHFDKVKLHYFDDQDRQDILENSLNYPALELAIEHDSLHKHHNNKKHYNVKNKQRINDKFLKWDDDDDDSSSSEADDLDDGGYEIKKHNKKHAEHKFPKTNHRTYHKAERHYNNLESSEEEDDGDEEEGEYNSDTILDKHAKPTWNAKKWKDDLVEVHKGVKHKNAARLAKLEDEKKLEEWLIQSKKQFKDRKDNLLKTLKEERMDSYDSDKRIRLNYPLFNTNDRFSDSLKYTMKNNDKSKKQTKHMESEVELFKELIKNEESQEMELATLMSNKKEQPFHYKTMVTPSHRMFLGAPSVTDITGKVKDPQEVIKEEMGRNIIYEKSKFKVVPIINHHDKEEEILPVPFTAAERLVWDWQAMAIVSAIAACLLFFLVIAIFIVANARHWRREKYQFTSESEDMSTRLALIQPTLETSAAEANNTNRFLQQFLSANDNSKKEKIGNNELQKS